MLAWPIAFSCILAFLVGLASLAGLHLGLLNCAPRLFNDFKSCVGARLALDLAWIYLILDSVLDPKWPLLASLFYLKQIVVCLRTWDLIYLLVYFYLAFGDWAGGFNFASFLDFLCVARAPGARF